MKNKFEKFANNCEWYGCDEIWDGKKKSLFWFCSHALNIDERCCKENCPLLGEENPLKKEKINSPNWLQKWHDKYFLEFFYAYFGGRLREWFRSLFKEKSQRER